MCTDVCIDVCIDVCTDMCINVCIDECIGVHIDVCMDVRIGMRIHMRIYMRIHMRIHMRIDMCAALNPSMGSSFTALPGVHGIVDLSVCHAVSSSTIILPSMKKTYQRYYNIIIRSLGYYKAVIMP